MTTPATKPLPPPRRRPRALLALLCCAALGCAQESQPGQEPAPAQSGPAQSGPAQSGPAQSGPVQSGQDPQGDDAARGRQLAEAVRQQFAAQDIDIDVAAGTVTIPAVMNAPPDPIEYLLIHRKGKKHEAMFVTECRPSVLNAALLLLGLEPGKNATYREKDPPPTLEEIEQGADPLIITPPSGTELWMTVRWQDAAGQPVAYCVGDLIYDLRGEGPIGATSWVYLGGRLASLYKDEPEVFVADFEGNLVSVCYLSPDNHLATMRHERARDDQNWWLTNKCPEPGTPVQFTFHSRKPELCSQRDARLAEQGGDREAPQSDPPEGPPTGGRDR